MQSIQNESQKGHKTSTLPEDRTHPLSVFVSYSHRDEELKNELIDHLATLKRQGKIQAWNDRNIEAGTEWDAEIKRQLELAEIILLLISPQFIASNYCYDLEMQRAIERHDAGSARVIPIILRPVEWKETPFSKLAALPKDGKAITTWSNRDEAFLNVAQGIRKAVESLQRDRWGEQPCEKALSLSELRNKVRSLGDDPEQPSLEALSRLVREVRKGQ